METRPEVRWFAALLWIAMAASVAAVAVLAPAAWAQPPNAVRIDVANFMFAPTSTTVKAGTIVTWTNSDQEPHTVASSDGLFRSGALDTHDSFSFRFEKPGTYHYMCTIHPRMLGTIVVE